jgi:hypothetical protein
MSSAFAICSENAHRVSGNAAFIRTPDASRGRARTVPLDSTAVPHATNAHIFMRNGEPCDHVTSDENVSAGWKRGGELVEKAARGRPLPTYVGTSWVLKRAAPPQYAARFLTQSAHERAAEAARPCEG